MQTTELRKQISKIKISSQSQHREIIATFKLLADLLDSLNEDKPKTLIKLNLEGLKNEQKTLPDPAKPL